MNNARASRSIELGRYDEAEVLYRQALAIRVAGKGDTERSCRSNLGWLLLTRPGAYVEAEALYRAALAADTAGKLGARAPH